MTERYKIKKEYSPKCKDCAYSTRAGTLLFCNYYSIERQMRGCSASECDKFVEKGNAEVERKKQRLKREGLHPVFNAEPNRYKRTNHNDQKPK